MSPKSQTPSLVELTHLNPPPPPWEQIATIGSFYLLGDIEQLGAKWVAQFVNTHPLIAVKTGRKQHVVVGQFRSWELVRTFSHLHPKLFQKVPVYLQPLAKNSIGVMAAENLFAEGLIYSLAPENAAAQLANIWKRLPDASREKLLPMTRTHAEFANGLGYDSRTGFDSRRLNRVPNPVAESIVLDPPAQDEASDGIAEQSDGTA